MENDEEELGASMPASPNAEYYNSSALSVAIIAVMEMELPYDHNFPAIHLLNHSFLPINPRFSSIMVESENKGKKWKRVSVNVENHLKTARYPEDQPIEFYDKCLEEYLAKMAMEGFPKDQPLWEMHIFKYPSSKACWNLIFKLHHCLGDGYSLVGALLSTMQRADDPSLPLTFPSRRSTTSLKTAINVPFFKRIPRFISGFFVDTLKDFGWSVLKSSILEDDQSPIRSGKEMVELCPMNITNVRFSLDELKLIKTSLGVTINDVIVGIIFCGIRLYMMKERNGRFMGSAGANANALVVFNARTIGVGYKSVEEMLKPNSEMGWGNRFGFFHIAIPKMMMDEEENHDPLHFITEAHKMIKKKRNSAAVFLTTKLLQTMRKFRGSEVTSKYIYNAMKKSSMAVSNVIGPVEKMVLANHPIKGLFYTVTGIPQSLVITMMSYMGNLNVVFRTERDYIDSHLFNSCIHHAFQIILKASTAN